MRKFFSVCIVLLAAHTPAQAQERYYDFKSAVVEYVFEQGMNRKLVTEYIDDYGSRYVKVIRSGFTSNPDPETYRAEIVIWDNGSVTHVDMDDKTARALSFYQHDSQRNKVTPKALPQEPETVAGKECEVWVQPFGSESSGKFWLYRGYPLKILIENNGKVTEMAEVTRFEENAFVPADRFLVPEGIEVQR